MSRRMLVVFPGLASPHSPEYSSVYELLCRKALEKYEFSDCHVVIYPGQIGMDGWHLDGVLRFPEAIRAGREKLRSLAAGNISFRLLGLSFGCNVVLQILRELPAPFRLEKGVLWGPVPFWNAWRSFHIPEFGSRLKGRDTHMAPPLEFFGSLNPIEYLLSMIDIPVTIAAGSLDTYATPSYMEYLKTLSMESEEPKKRKLTLSQFHDFRAIEGCKHNVRDDGEQKIEDYLDTVLG